MKAAADDHQFLFVYGTLRPEFGHPLHHRLASVARPLGAAWFGGLLFDIGNYPGAVPSSDSRNRIRGELFAIPAGRAGTLFQVLDEYEDCSPRTAPASQFAREKHAVFCEGRAYESWVYVYRWPTEGYRRIVDGDYLSFLHRRGS